MVNFNITTKNGLNAIEKYKFYWFKYAYLLSYWYTG